MARATEPVSIQIDGVSVEFDALMEESQTREADVPTYPVESGFEVSDTIILKALSLSMTLFVTNSPVTWKDIHTPGSTRVHDIIAKLEKVYFSHTPVTVITTDKTYTNMAITHIELSKKLETGTSREIPIEFQEIRVTESQTTTIPDSYGRSGATGKNAGTANTATGATGSAGSGTGAGGSGNDAGGNKGSVLWNISKGGGLTNAASSLTGGLFGGGSG